MTSADLVPITTEHLLRFLSEQEAHEEAQYDELMATPLEQRISQGYSLANLTVRRTLKDGVWLHCGAQIARYRRGDHIRLSSGSTSVAATVLDHADSEIFVKPGKKLDPKANWIADPVFESFLAVAQKAAQCVKPMRGQFLLDALNGQPFVATSEDGLQDVNGVVAELEAETGVALDASQRQAFFAAAGLPTLWALQGPPGTGKTRTAAFIGEALSRASHRVVVVAQSHEAVNRLLAEWKLLFPARGVIKIEPGLRVRRGESVESISMQAFWKQRKRILGDRPIIGMTVHTALLLGTVYGFRADVVLVDEASQTPVTHGALLGLLGFAVLMFGDPAQLGAIFPQAVRENPLAISLMDRYALYYGLHFLAQTHRLNAPLADIIGRVFYPDAGGMSRLVSTPHAAGRRLSLGSDVVDPWVADVLNPIHPFVWVQSAESGNRQFSKHEAQVVARLVQALKACKIAMTEVAIVTPFRQQQQLVTREISAVVGGKRPLVGTAEIMQGQSVEVVLVSLCASDLIYLGQIADFFFTSNRWNVAFSRARTKVIIVASNHLSEALPDFGGAASCLCHALALAHLVEIGLPPSI